MELVSIIIPVYNSAAVLASTIESALDQTYPYKEIIVVDDGSTDESYRIAKAYDSAYIKAIQQRSAGAAVARNTGLEVAKGDFIQFLDAGDLLSSNKIELQVAALKNNPDKVAVCNYKQFTNEEDLKNDIYPDQSSFIYSSEDPQDFLIRLWGGYGEMNFIQTNCWLVPKNIIDKAGKWRAFRCPDDDGEYFARVLLESNGIVNVPGAYNYYHIHPKGINQLSQNRNLKYLKNTLLTIDLKYQYLLRKNHHPFLNRAIASQYLNFAINVFPAQKSLSSIALKRYMHFKIKVPFPVLGGRFIELIKLLFGWKAARIMRYYLREKEY
jgi:glycosyltransferase involved in cell wall biosynthesis